jgi:hypothetical protein
VTCDEVTSIDNGSWISIHMYVVEKWSRVPILITLAHVLERATPDTQLIIDAVKDKGGLAHNDIPERLMCFGAGELQLFIMLYIQLLFQFYSYKLVHF